jgi:hypothetical protein
MKPFDNMIRLGSKLGFVLPVNNWVEDEDGEEEEEEEEEKAAIIIDIGGDDDDDGKTFLFCLIRSDVFFKELNLINVGEKRMRLFFDLLQDFRK